MLLKFATKQNRNGNRSYIAIDSEAKTYSKNPTLWLCKGDFVEVTKAALQLIEDKAKVDNYKYVDSL